MIRPLHKEALSARTIKKGDLIVPITYGSDHTPTSKIEYAAFDTVTVVSKDMRRGTVDVVTGIHQSRTMTFKELGLPRFTVPRLRLGFWRRHVCTVPHTVAHDMMRDYIDANRPRLNRGPGFGPFNPAQISKNKIGLDGRDVLTPWDRDKLAS